MGHGVVVPEEPRPVAFYQSQNINQIIGRGDKGPRDQPLSRDASRDVQQLSRDQSRGHMFSGQQTVVQNGLGPRGGGCLCIIVACTFILDLSCNFC